MKAECAMRILFTTFYDPDHIGTKLLAGYMHSLGHTVRYLQFKTFPIFDKKYNLPDSQVATEKGKMVIKNVYQKGWQPITDIEIDLFTSFVRNFAPEIFCFSYRNVTAEVVKEMISFARSAAPAALFVCGGFGPTFEPDYALRVIGFDVAVRGEGEEPLREIVEAVATGASWKSIKNCSYLDKGTMISNPLRPLLRNLDAYPFQISKEYIAHIEHNVLAEGDYRTPGEWPLRGCGYPVMATRGCPLHCSYCSSVSGLRDLYTNSHILAIPYRRRALTHVLDELRFAKQHGEKSFTFVDEFVIYPHEELAEFLRLYKRDINCFFFAYFNTEQFLRHEALIDLAIDAGLVAAFFGVQNGSEKFCREIYNRINCNEHYLTLARKFFDRGIMSEWSYIIGNLLENEKD
ncbi:MAG: cobalamin-dependent protein, partial [Desulfovibrio sp.]|nr:cobalamin-dependent protein [Desulfovibrio sp.]